MQLISLRMIQSIAIVSIILWCAQLQGLASIIRVNSLTDFNTAIAKSDSKIKLSPGNYDLKNLSGKRKVINFSGSNNIIDLRGVSVNVTVGLVRDSYIVIKGNNNTIVGGEFEDTYQNGLTEIVDFSAYNKDKESLAFGLRGAAVMSVLGKHNTIKNIKLTVRGSWPYGYGSYYGIGAYNTFGLNKRCGILIKEKGNTIDGAEVQMRAFGHGIYMQGKADKTVIKNCHVEGRVRKTADLYSEIDPKDLPSRSNFRFPNRDDFKLNSPGSYAMPKDEVHSLCEDGIRMYAIPGSVTVENCTVIRMRGGIRLYLGGPATVKNCKVMFCEYTAYNLPNGGVVIKSEGDFSFGPISDYRGGRRSSKAEWTILRSPHATGDHNIMDLLGDGHHITLKRKPGRLDLEETRAIIVSGNKSTIINKTEYTIVLEKSSRDNQIQSYGPVKDLGRGNNVTKLKSTQ